MVKAVRFLLLKTDPINRPDLNYYQRRKQSCKIWSTSVIVNSRMRQVVFCLKIESPLSKPKKFLMLDSEKVPW